MNNYKQLYENLATDIQSALNMANGRWDEWGMRAEMVRDILENALERNIDEENTKSSD